MNYKDSGVDIAAANEAVARISQRVRSTFTPGVLTDIGAFSGLFQLDKSAYEEPVLVSSTDGVGTKVMIAQMLNQHDTVGIDLVAMSVNDLLCMGAKPLFFMDYIACGRVDPLKIEKIVTGIVEGCQQSGCALMGGETAEMPGIYGAEEYDLAGFVVGVIDKKNIIDGAKIQEGDVLIGLPSSGLHSNGYSLARKALLDAGQLKLPDIPQGWRHSLGEELLIPTRIYAKEVDTLCALFDIHGIAHITGGAFYEKIIRIVPKELGIAISYESWLVPPIFELIQEKGSIAREEMYRAFNMGIGMVFIVSSEDKTAIIKQLDDDRQEAFVIGEITAKAGSVCFV